MNHAQTFNWVFKNQTLALGTLTQPSRCNKAESNLLAEEIGYTYKFIDLFNQL